MPPNDNVWVDVATQWRQLLTQPDQAAHALGKLLSRVGEQRVLWGTDAIWYGSPEAQIMAMRAFQITAEFQDRYHYPALTDTVKAGLFGLNAAKLFGVDPTATRCGLTADPLTREHPGGRPAARRGRAALAPGRRTGRPPGARSWTGSPRRSPTGCRRRAAGSVSGRAEGPVSGGRPGTSG